MKTTRENKGFLHEKREIPSGATLPNPLHLFGRVV
jgi:hypothetical protein